MLQYDSWAMLWLVDGTNHNVARGSPSQYPATNLVVYGRDDGTLGGTSIIMVLVDWKNSPSIHAKSPPPLPPMHRDSWLTNNVVTFHGIKIKPWKNDNVTRRSQAPWKKNNITTTSLHYFSLCETDLFPFSRSLACAGRSDLFWYDDYSITYSLLA